MTERIRRTIALIVAVMSVLATAQAASATTKVTSREAYFKASVEGVQTSKWTADHKPSNSCDPAYTGSGSERVTFASPRPVKVHAFQFNKAFASFLNVRGGALSVIPTKGWVRRKGTVNTPPSDPACAVGDGDGTAKPPASDCGRKRITSLRLRLAFDALKKERVTLSRDDQQQAPEFSNCPLKVPGWHVFLSSDDKNRTAGENLPYDDLFDKRQGKMLVIGKGTVKTNSAGVVGTTHIEWTLTLRRLKHK